MLNDITNPKRAASLMACTYNSLQAGEPQSGPSGTSPFPLCFCPPASNMQAPLKPLAFISSKSRVMASLVTFPFSHHHQQRMPYSCVGFLKISSDSSLPDNSLPDCPDKSVREKRNNTAHVILDKETNSVFGFIRV